MWFEEEKLKLYVKPYPQSLKVFSLGEKEKEKKKMHFFLPGTNRGFLTSANLVWKTQISHDILSFYLRKLLTQSDLIRWIWP